ncbi:cupin domain-containing protein [Clostridium minihomine]|uniref:cupin domain-containing protein n=1 Tax=Clostridium minihomine TaxID=2045012 RepID=UPI000C75A641|nr:cupin domain-containing protein [Clostridium minihomine]
MKKLVTMKDVEESLQQGKKVVVIDSNTIVTPAAMDFAKESGVEFSTHASCENMCRTESDSGGSIDSELIYRALKSLMEKGLLQDVIDAISGRKYAEDRDNSGLKVVRGDSVKLDPFDTGNPNGNVQYQELVSKEESKMSAGFLVIENSRFDWNLTYEEIDYVIEGTLNVTINGKTYTAKAGDVLFVPSGSQVVWGSPDKARIFYTTYPANWPDLL